MARVGLIARAAPRAALAVLLAAPARADPVAVGALHLVGADSLVPMFEALGYTAERAAPCRAARPLQAGVDVLDFEHLEVFLARATFGAAPRQRDVFPLRAGLDAFLRQAGGFVVDEAAD